MNAKGWDSVKKTTKLTMGFLGACALFSSNLYAVESGGAVTVDAGSAGTSAAVGAGTGFKIGGEGIPVGDGAVIAFETLLGPGLLDLVRQLCTNAPDLLARARNR